MLAKRFSCRYVKRFYSLTKTDVILPNLPYSFDAFEPIISSEMMKNHYEGHASCVNKLTEIHKMLQHSEENKSKDYLHLLCGQGNLMNYYSDAHINHSILWTNLTKEGGEPSEALLEAIKKDFGSLEKMQETLSDTAITIKGEGWAWLGYCPKSKSLKSVATIEEQTLKNATGMTALFGIDVWEHAYYDQYKDNRKDYVKAIWKITNWKNISKRYNKARNEV